MTIKTLKNCSQKIIIPYYRPLVVHLLLFVSFAELINSIPELLFVSFAELINSIPEPVPDLINNGVKHVYVSQQIIAIRPHLSLTIC